MNSIIDIIAIIISFFSLIVSVVGNMLSTIKRPIMFNTSDIEINDSYELLFDTDGKPNNEVTMQIANFNNQDVLFYLYEGCISVKNNEKKLDELYSVKPKYYTLKANSVSNITITIDVVKKDNCSNGCMYLNFEYHDGIRKQKIHFANKKDRSEKCVHT